MRGRFVMIFALMAVGLCVSFALGSQPSVVFASVYFHGDFASNAQSCGSCHRVHFSETASLLSHGSNETEFCYYCHGDGNGENSSGYNVQSGEITVGNEKRPSYAGGFEKSIDPSRSNSIDMVFPNTSMHNIEPPEGNGEALQLQDGDIPGGGQWQGTFKCGSCHDPHGGGQYPTTPYRNPRLLRETLLGDTTKRYVYMSIDYGNTNLPLAYGAGFNNWCGGCHDKFNTEGADRTGAVGDLSMSKFRHKVGVKIPEQVFSTDLGTGLPVATDTQGQWWLNCMTCHRAHGSSVSVSIGFTRYNSSAERYNDGENQSTLLRLPERGVCFKCHGSSEYNKYNPNEVDKYGTGW